MDLTEEVVLDAAARVLLQSDLCITVNITPGAILFRIPTTRKLAEYLGVPHYAILPVFAAMEEKELIVRVERVGISTTAKGSRILFGLLDERYRKDTEALLGRELCRDLRERVMQPPGDIPR
jgi:DNA-binding transcriptional regulator YhcF (GntR family)